VRTDLARADRAAAVRDAARSWRRAGILDEAAFGAVASRFPDDRARVGPVFRALFFLFTMIAVSGGAGFVAMAIGGGHDGVVAGWSLIAGLALAAATDYLIGPLRRRQGGIEAAASLMAIAFLLAAAAWCLYSSGGLDLHLEDHLWALCLIAAVLAGVAAWRWGYPLYAGAATAAAFAAGAHLPAARALWIVLPLAAAPALLRLAESSRLPPAHRGSAMAVLLVALTGLYLAVHLGSWDRRLVEELGGRPASAPDSPLSGLAHGGLPRWAAVAGTALVPIALLALGLRRRRLPLLLAGTAAAAVSLVTLRHYVHFWPIWAVLCLAGALVIALALAIWRYLESGAGQERAGFTAAPLLTDRGRQALLEAAATALTFQPPSHAATPAEPQFTGEGGRSGGAGASGEF